MVGINGRVVFAKVLQGLGAAVQIIEEVGQRHPATGKERYPARRFGIYVDDVGSHNCIGFVIKVTYFPASIAHPVVAHAAPKPPPARRRDVAGAAVGYTRCR